MKLRDMITWIKGVIYKMLHLNDAKRTLGADIAISSEMQTAIDQWTLMFQDNAPWLDSNTQSLGLPAAIAGEISRLVTVEMESGITGSPRADFLQAEYQKVLDNLRVNLEYAAASGGLTFKPYLNGGHIVVDCVPAWRFLPTAFNSRGEVTGAVFVEQTQKGKCFHTRMEHHQLVGEGYIIKNLAFKSFDKTNLGAPTSLSDVDEWAELEPELKINRRDGTALERPLFAYFKMPFANTIDTSSPLGVSAYSRAVGLIEQADKQYSRILWEYEGSELAIDATEGALRIEDSARKKLIRVPERRKRLFRELSIEQGSRGDLYNVFSPEIRDGSLFNGLDRLLKRIEFNCYLSYGTLSDPQSVEKTAEEIRSSKQRSFTAVSDVQKALGSALEHLVWVMDIYASIYKLAPAGKYDVNFTWGDGILEDADKEFIRRKSLVDSGLLRPEKFISWYFGVAEKDALKDYIPQAAPPLFPLEG